MDNIKNDLTLSHNMLLVLVHAFLLLPIINLLMTINRIPGKGLLFTFFILTHLSALSLRKWWHYLLVQSVASLMFLYLRFPSVVDSLTFREWAANTWALGLDQWADLMASNLTEVPVLLLMSGLLLLITLFTFLLIHFKTALPSLFAGLVYLMILHTFTSRMILPYLIALIGFGFLLIALTQTGIQSSWFAFTTSTLLSSLFIILIIFLAYFGLSSLRFSQEWVETKSATFQKDLDERDVFDWINDQASGFGIRRTGMGTNDTNLGGRLHQDFSPVFEAYTSRPHYWKVLHRTEYTGSGWKSDYDDYFETIRSPYNILLDATQENAQRETLLEADETSSVKLEWFEPLSYIAYPYGWFDIELTDNDADYTMELNQRSGYFNIESGSESLDHYTLTYDTSFPDRFDEEALRLDDGWRDEAVDTYKEMNAGEHFAELDDDALFYLWFENELHLPASLPQRVIDLAHEITEGLTSEYDMVRAVETYLKEDSGYRYSLLDVEQTPAGEDYVDHFLFESEIGYCDNFSTSMTVLLRAVGIPARWTKGFTPGSLITSELGEEYFLVDNSNAHSWPEVYFPSHGWVPFEPSPSFANPVTNLESVATIRGETYSFDDDDVVEIDEQSETEASLEEESVSDDTTDEPSGLEEGTPDDAESDGASSDSNQLSDQRLRHRMYSIGITLLLSGSLIAIFRWHTLLWLPKLLIRKRLLSLSQASSLILKLYYLKHKPATGQTIQDYMDEWKPFASDHTDLLDQFSELANQAFYKSVAPSHKTSIEQQTILLEMLALYPALPHTDNKATRTIY